LFKPAAVQSPRIPVWVAAHWPLKRPLQRAARWDGALPRQWNTGTITPAVVREIDTYIKKHRDADTTFDICKFGLTDGKNPAQVRAMVQEFSSAGATWWSEEIFTSRVTLKQIERRIAAGLPQ